MYLWGRARNSMASMAQSDTTDKMGQWISSGKILSQAHHRRKTGRKMFEWPDYNLMTFANNYNSTYLQTLNPLIAGLYYMKDTGSMSMTANMFGIHQSISKVVFEVCNAITMHLWPEYIHLPQTVEKMQRKISEFELKFGMSVLDMIIVTIILSQ